eukprot:TRINITY_DN424_c0_g1_i3.p1 TRINITY_DN424_c0_g1~~TRINITY_DN424_c0_g1_i3.p1  ORF type:complete len:398 (+),score=141.15 TRINITY_DN424_c0_g1_i3:55-1248(+)
MTMRAATAAMLCWAGVTAQPAVSLGGANLPGVPANTAEGRGFSDNAEISVLPSWMASSAAWYHRVPSFTSDSLVLTPDNNGVVGRSASTLGRGNNANSDNNNAENENACGMGWAQSMGENVCFETIQGLPKNAWGWTNKIEQDESFEDIPVFIGASQCAGGHHRFNIDVSYSGTTVTVDLSDGGKNSLRAAQVYVGKKILPDAPNGAPSASPGQFPVKVNVGSDPVVTFEGLDGGAYYFAVHVNTCPAKEATTPPPSTPPPQQPSTPPPSTPPPQQPCASTFYIAQYVCPWGPCAEGVNGNLGVRLVGEGWEVLKGSGPCFTLPETELFPHQTQVFMKEITEEEATPESLGLTNYVGVWSAGCGCALATPEWVRKAGPVRALCKDFCPPGSAGAAGQ